MEIHVDPSQVGRRNFEGTSGSKVPESDMRELFLAVLFLHRKKFLLYCLGNVLIVSVWYHKGGRIEWLSV